MPGHRGLSADLMTRGSPEGDWYIEPMAGWRLGWGELTQSGMELGNTAVIPEL